MDDHPVIWKGLRQVMEEQPDMLIIAEASNGRMAVQLAETLTPDVVVMDINLPIMNGLEATRAITAHHPKQL